MSIASLKVVGKMAAGKSKKKRKLEAESSWTLMYIDLARLLSGVYNSRHKAVSVSVKHS